MIYKFLSIALLATAAVASLLALQRSMVCLNCPVAQTPPLQPSVPTLAGFEDDSPLRMHVSYNSLTGGRSKLVLRKGTEKRFVLMGESDSTLFRCVVSEEFWNAVEENTRVSLPKRLCSEIRPEVAASPVPPLTLPQCASASMVTAGIPVTAAVATTATTALLVKN
jgi:hypothetical protein